MSFFEEEAIESSYSSLSETEEEVPCTLVEDDDFPPIFIVSDDDNEN